MLKLEVVDITAVEELEVVVPEDRDCALEVAVDTADEVEDIVDELLVLVVFSASNW